MADPNKPEPSDPAYAELISRIEALESEAGNFRRDIQEIRGELYTLTSSSGTVESLSDRVDRLQARIDDAERGRGPFDQVVPSPE